MSTDLKAKYGNWALVTGASAGIGKAFAESLAQKGINIVLVARNKEKLQQTESYLQIKYKISTVSIAADLNETTGIEKVINETSSMKIGILVNNAGNGYVDSFLNSTPERLLEYHTLNVIAPLKLTHHFSKQMITTQQKGAIIFVSSMAAYQGIGYMSTYAAEKAYMLMLGESLYFELKKNNIDVTVVSPGPTDTELGRKTEGMDNSKLPMIYMKPSALAEITLGKLGKAPSLIPGTVNKLTAFLGKHILSRKGNAGLWSSIIAKAKIN
jgi:uncharacterized protein